MTDSETTPNGENHEGPSREPPSPEVQALVARYFELIGREGSDSAAAAEFFDDHGENQEFVWRARLICQLRSDLGKSTLEFVKQRSETFVGDVERLAGLLGGLLEKAVASIPEKEWWRFWSQQGPFSQE